MFISRGLIVGVSLGVMLLFAVPITAAGDGIESDKERIYQLVAEGRDVQVVDEVGETVWTASSDIELLILYCESLFTLSPEMETCRISESSAPEAKRFVFGLWNVWLGRVQKAEAAFRDLLERPEWALWGQAGLAELARNTEDHRTLAQVVQELSSAQRAGTHAGMLHERYRFLLAEATADWRFLEEHLSRYSREEVLDSPHLFSTQMRWLFRQDQVKAVERLLTDASAPVKRTLVYDLVKAEYTALTQGLGWGEAIRDVASHYPESRRLVLEVALDELFSESPRQAEAALETIHSVAASSRRDVQLLLDLATKLALYRRPHDSGRVYRLIEVGQADLNEFAEFHVLAAWNAVYGGDYDRANTRLKHALAMAPMKTSSNWLKALIAKREKDQVSGCEAVNALLRQDSGNQNFVSLAKHFSEISGGPACWPLRADAEAERADRVG